MAAENTVDEKKGRRRKRKGDGDIAESGKSQTTRGRRGQSSSGGGGGNFITRTFGGMFEYISDVRNELRKVTWPTPEDVRRLTIVVLAVTIASSIVLGLFSLLVGEVIRIGIQQPIILLVIGIAAIVTAVWYTRRGPAGRSY